MVLAQYLDYEVVDLVFLCILVQETSKKLWRGPVLSRFWCFSRFSSLGGCLFWPFLRLTLAETIFLRLAYCRRRLFFGEKWQQPFSSNWPIAAGAFFLVKNDILGSKTSFLRSKTSFFLIKKGACGKPPGGGKSSFSQRNAIFTQRKAPAAIGQPEENGFWSKTQFF